MSTKEGRKAQVTIFMILGFLVLFIFVFLILLLGGLRKEQLQSAREEVLTKDFHKEGLRIFVQDCFYDALEKGLLLLGKQGRLWSDQPGGRRDFVEGITGTAFPGELPKEGGRVYYGISRKEYSTDKNAYPCLSDVNPPAFCRYQFPNAATFGELNLRPEAIKDDLRRYLENRTKDCIYNFTVTSISSIAEIEPTTMNIALDLKDEGISVTVEYPLKFKIGGNTSFYLSNFDFFYPTQFRKLLEAAITFPLQYDYQYVDYQYKDDTLKSAAFPYHRNTPEPPLSHSF